MTPKSFMYHLPTHILPGKHRISNTPSQCQTGTTPTFSLRRYREEKNMHGTRTSSSLRWRLWRNLVNHRIGVTREPRVKDRGWHSEAIGNCGTAQSTSLKRLATSVEYRIKMLSQSFFRFVSYTMNPIQMADRLFEDMNQPCRDTRELETNLLRD